ncbi:NADPH-dependent oxidoreductase [Clostridium fermenticellae]|uniref:NADPH-dependent oxidoreductase n=1 Tax=Clostridium fermenticellae TaxID=2068654 RepID=A0A386H3L4_9CLOT|nr:NAD(P)H-dependent oxidoreductase [Clostridium fermenticellae]AYD40282.1 NADPH-dependent oxidoreductase [Clostridium fermenticellae]
MRELYVICPSKSSIQLKNMINAFVKAFSSVKYINGTQSYVSFQRKKILFCVELNSICIDVPMFNFLEELRNKSKNAFENSVGALLLHTNSELGSKRSAQDIIFIANNLGCTFIGQPLVEITVNFKNFLTWQKTYSDLSLKDISIKLSQKLGERLLKYENTISSGGNKKLTVLYSSPHKISNTLDLWHLTSKHMKNIDIHEIQIENENILDCKGCHYKLCLHYGKQNSCFYGGFITENVLPSIQCSDIIVWLCPNYNDSIGANLSAVINRLTVLYHKISFYNKSIFGIVVSGNSGSDSVAKQLIGSLNINKGFKLPPYAIMTETANDPKTIFKIPGIEIKSESFAKNIIKSL